MYLGMYVRMHACTKHAKCKYVHVYMYKYISTHVSICSQTCTDRYDDMCVSIYRSHRSLTRAGVWEEFRHWVDSAKALGTMPTQME